MTASLLIRNIRPNAGAALDILIENGRISRMAKDIAAPAGVAIFPRDIAHPPREWGERIFDVRRWTVMPRGGHFAAHEEPELLAAELREFFRPFRA